MSKYVDATPNPIVEARALAAMSLKRLGRELDMSAQYISSAEHGTYSDINERLVNYSAERLGIDAEAVMYRYKDFQKETRRRSANEINPKMLTRGLIAAPGHLIFRNWRAIYWPSPVAFANAFCVHPEVVRTYEDGTRGSIPNQVLRALQSVKLIDPNWSEMPPARRMSNHGPVAKKQIAVAEHSGSALVIRLPGQRRSGPF